MCTFRGLIVFHLLMWYYSRAMKNQQEHNSNITKGVSFHRFVYKSLRFCFGWALKLVCRFSYDKYDVKNPLFLMLSNHNNDMDPILEVVALNRHMRFVASSTILQGFGGWIVRTLVGPIPRVKGASADDTVELIEQNLKEGISVAMYPEGNKSWDGQTCYISPRTAKLLKDVPVALVTYRIEGGYLKSPRWSRFPRKGPIHGHVINEYSAEELAAMSQDEIYSHICEDLYANAYNYQRTAMKKYSGKALAEGIENVGYLCPSCHCFGSIKSHEKSFFCSCGLSASYDEYGFLSGEKLPFTTIYEWNKWQKKWLSENVTTLKALTEAGRPITEDKSLAFSENIGEEHIILHPNVTCSLYGDRMVITPVHGEGLAALNESATITEPLEIPWAEVEKLSIFRSTRVMFTWHGRALEFRHATGFPGLKYYALWRTLTGKEYL